MEIEKQQEETSPLMVDDTRFCFMMTKEINDYLSSTNDFLTITERKTPDG